MGDGERRMVVGVGNPDRGDDGVGQVVARLLRNAVTGDVRVVEQDGSAAGLIELLCQADCAFLVDAMVSGAATGTVRRLDCCAEDAIPAAAGSSSHGFGVAEAVGLARALGCLPARCVVYAVEGAEFSTGATMSPAVVAAARDVSRRILEEFDTPRCGPCCA